MEDRGDTKRLEESKHFPVHKKGSMRVCKNYRGISLLSVPGQVFGKILNDRMRSITEGKIMEEQVHGVQIRERMCRE